MAAGGGSPGYPNPLYDPDPGDWFSQKGGTFSGTGGGGTGPGGGGGVGSIFGSGGFGGPTGPVYDRGVPQYGYRRLPMGPVFNQRTQGPAGNGYQMRFGQPTWQSGGYPTQGTMVGPGAQGMASPGVSLPGSGFPGSMPMPAQQMGGYDYGGFTPQGSPTGGYSQSDPWSAYGGDQRGDLLGAANRLFGGAGQAGVFDPLGSPALLDAISQQINSQAGGRQAGIRNSLLAGGAADDPNAFAYGSLMGDLGLQHDLSGAETNARLQSMMQNQGWNQNFANQLMGAALGNQQMYAMMNRMPSQNGFAQLLGSLGGPALGSLGSLFGGGAALGAGAAGAGAGIGGGFDMLPMLLA